MTKINKFTQSAIASAVFLMANTAYSAAFQLAEVSTVGLGRAYAGEAAMIDNASVVATNPALMSYFKNYQFSVGAIYIDSKVDVSGPVNTTLGGVTIATGSAEQNSIVPGSAIPNFYFVAPINDKFALGGGVNVNFGLKTEYDTNYDAGIFGGQTGLEAINFNLSGSYRATERLSLGLGANAIYAGAEVSRHAGIIGTLTDRLTNFDADNLSAADYQLVTNMLDESNFIAVYNTLNIKTNSVLTHLQDKSAWGFGWNAGLSYDINEHHRFGLAYHSKVDIQFKDSLAISNAGLTVGSGSLTLKLPSYWEFSGFHQVTDKLALHYSYKYTEWKRFQDLHATYDDGTLAFHKDENYQNNSRFAFGATYDVNDKLTLRAGIAYDERAAPTEYASASIPDTDRTWYSVGATYRFTPNLSVDLGFAHLRGKKVEFQEYQSMMTLLGVEVDYTSKASSNLYGLNLNYSF